METLAQRLARKKAEITAAAPRLVLGMATAGLSLVRRRIEEQGVPGASYSTSFIPTFLFSKQALNAGGRAYIKKNRLGTWGGLRQAEGLPSDRVTLAHSNRMWNSLLAQLGASQGPIATAKIVSSDREGADRVKYNKVRYGDFLQPNAQETQQIAAFPDREIQRILQAP